MPALLQRLATEDPTAPRLTFYSADYARTGERIELSARVLSVWVAKTANLLEEEFEVGPGRRVGLDLPTHWRTVIWQLATWATGAAVVMASAEDLDVSVSSAPEALSTSAAAGVETIAVSLLPLATSFGAGLPTGVLDYARVVTGYGDEHAPIEEPLTTDPALVIADETLQHGALVQRAVEAGSAGPSASDY